MLVLFNLQLVIIICLFLFFFVFFRHLTFYIWRRILQYPTIRVFLGIPYYIAITSVLSELSLLRGPIWIFGYLVALGLTLGFTPLLELRYFTPGIMITVLNCDWKNESKVKNLKIKQKVDDVNTKKEEEMIDFNMILVSILGLSISIILCMIVLYLLLFVYTKKAFTWHDGSIARFML